MTRSRLYILIGTIVFTGIILFVTYRYVNQTLTDSLIEQGKIVATNLEEVAAERLIEEDIIALRSTVEKYKQYANIEYIIIEDFTEEILTDTYNGNVPNDIMLGRAGEETTESQEETVKLIEVHSLNIQVYDILQPIKEGLLGFVRVGMKKSFVDERIQETITYLGIVFLIGTFLAIIMAIFIITLQFSRPIAYLTDAAHKISMGELEKPIRVRVKNEIGVLGDAIERMRVSLKSSIDRLRTR